MKLFRLPLSKRQTILAVGLVVLFASSGVLAYWQLSRTQSSPKKGTTATRPTESSQSPTSSGGGTATPKKDASPPKQPDKTTKPAQPASPSQTPQVGTPSSGSTAPPASGGSSGGGAAAVWWSPPTGNVPWQWELDHPLNTASASDLGTGVTTYTGAAAPDPVLYDIDGFDNSAGTVSSLHARGAKVLCYIEVGAAENYRPDYSQFPADTLGNTMPGYASERYVNIEDSRVMTIIKARIAMCQSKGFDGIEPDIDDSYTANTGFPISKADNVAYNAALADYAHSIGLSYGLKNGDDPSFAAQMLPHVDFALVEQCFEYNTCGSYYPSYANAGKAVFEVEYNIPTSSFCATANTYGFNAMHKDVDLSGGRQPCR